jgi:5'-3' exonuclease
MPRDWLIVDAPNAVMRAFYGVGQREPLPSILLAIHDVQNLAAEFGVTDVAWAFDRPPYKRKDLFAGYKASRAARKVDEAEQAALDDVRGRITKLANDYLPRLGYQNLFARAGFEADDMMAAAVVGLREADRAILMSGDKDLYQLLSGRCAVYHPITKEFVTANSFRAKYGIEPKVWPQVKAIAGCASDDIPKVEGVGELTAIKHLTKRLPRTHKVAYDIHEFVKTPAYELNLKLTWLPFPGTPPVNLVPDPPRPESGWRALCERLDLGRLAEAMESHSTFGELVNG